MAVREIPLSKLGLMTVADGAKRIGYAQRTLQRWIQDGRILVVVVGPTGRRSQYLLRKADLDKFIPPEREGLAEDAPKSKRGRPVGS